MTALRCVICHRQLRRPAATITRAGVTGHLGPKCAAALPELTRPAKDKPGRAARVRITRGGRSSAAQLDWVDALSAARDVAATTGAHP